MTVEDLEQTTDTNGPTLPSVEKGEIEIPKNGVRTPIVQDLVDTIEPLLKPPKSSSYPTPSISLEQRHIDEPRELRVAVIGAGLSGILAGILLPAKVPNIKLTIFEKNADVVSTVVYAFRFPFSLITQS